MKHLVIGCGQIGRAIEELLVEHGYWVNVWDISEEVQCGRSTLDTPYDVIHICFPYSDKFVEAVEEYLLLDMSVLLTQESVPGVYSSVSFKNNNPSVPADPIAQKTSREPAIPYPKEWWEESETKQLE